MIRTKRANNAYDGVGLIVYKVASMFKPPGSRNSLERGQMLFRRVDVDEEPLSVAQMSEFGESDTARRNPRVEQIGLEFIRREHLSDNRFQRLVVDRRERLQAVRLIQRNRN